MFESKRISILLLIISISIKSSELASKCNRTPEGHGANKTPADGTFHIRISESAAKYTPGKTYTITLEGIDAGTRQMPVTVRHTFSGFMLVVEKRSNELGDDDSNTSSLASHGIFTLLHGDTLSKITCINMVTHTTSALKSEIQVLWTAPQPGSGCVVFKATVIQHRDVWFMDDGPLSKEFCEDVQTFDDTLSSQLDPCCACSEAKYELAFEGLWSRNTHPKDFPSNSWLTRFSDIIGATHTVGYRFWQYGEHASDGLQQVAEHGATRLLEAELKGQSEEIRTIIKARGLSHPNVTGKTFAVFRVDPNHHLVSFVSMMDPSPDWFVGVSGLELCLENCSWIENRVIDLYPWDAGTDSGPTYISPDQPTSPRDAIRRIKPDFPNDPRSPFNDPSSSTMKPLARLYLSRQRLYEKNCSDNINEESNSRDKEACRTTSWSDWSDCDAKCGKGTTYRQRNFIDEDRAAQMGCRKKSLTQTKECEGDGYGCEENMDEVEDQTEPNCAIGPWSSWSECRPKCESGNGMSTQTRTRNYINLRKNTRKMCEGGDNHKKLVDTRPCEEKCVGEISPSGEENGGGQENETNGDEEEENQDENEGEVETTTIFCEMKTTNWSPCSAECGGGVRQRKKVPKNRNRCGHIEEEIEEKFCNIKPCEIPDYCLEEVDASGCASTRLFRVYNKDRNQCGYSMLCDDYEHAFESDEQCLETCTGYTTQYSQSDQFQNNNNNGNETPTPRRDRKKNKKNRRPFDK